MEKSLQSSFESERLSSSSSLIQSMYITNTLDNKENIQINNIKKRKLVGVDDASKSKRRHLNTDIVLLSYEERVL
jgi:hypothetical protein